MNTFRMHRLHARGAGAALLVATAALALLAGCTNARLTHVWSAPDWRGGSLQAVLVVSRETDPVARRLTEDELGARLRTAGVNAVSAYTIFADGPPSQAEMTGAMRDRDLDGALVVRPLKATTRTEWVSGWTSVEPRTYYNPWRERSVVVDRVVRHRGYHVVDRIQRTQLTLWAGESKVQMVWAGTLEDEEPGSSDAARHDLAAGLVPGLERAGFLARERRPA